MKDKKQLITDFSTSLKNLRGGIYSIDLYKTLRQRSLTYPYLNIEIWKYIKINLPKINGLISSKMETDGYSLDAVMGILGKILIGDAVYPTIRMIDYIVKGIKNKSNYLVLDLMTGAGISAVSTYLTLKSKNKDAKVTLISVDLSEYSMLIAAILSTLNDVDFVFVNNIYDVSKLKNNKFDGIILVKGDVFTLTDNLLYCYDIVISDHGLSYFNNKVVHPIVEKLLSTMSENSILGISSLVPNVELAHKKWLTVQIIKALFGLNYGFNEDYYVSYKKEHFKILLDVFYSPMTKDFLDFVNQYKLRSFKMLKFITEAVNLANSYSHDIKLDLASLQKFFEKKYLIKTFTYPPKQEYPLTKHLVVTKGK